uniref:Aminotransferase n=1 Tax=candidate division WOR-3 bacterium TaxID=2052148 RepID=A0A7C4U6P8_UNCW3
MRKVNPSSTLKVLENAMMRKKKGIDITILAAGEPDFDTPDYIKECAKKAIESGKTKYTPVGGILELREEISKSLKREKGLDYSPEQILVSSGAKQSIFNILFTLVGKDDEVIIPIPYWVSYPEMVKLCDGKPVFVESKDDFHLNIDAIKRKINSRTKVIIINSPNNPTGIVYNKDEIFELSEIIKDKNIYVISDEIYDKLIYENVQNFSIAQIDWMKEKTFIINGVSKSYAMTGWRIGWAAGPKNEINAAKNIQSHTTSCPSSISQYASLCALKDDNAVIKMREKFEERRNFCIDFLNGIEGIKYPKPYGAFYFFIDISKYEKDSIKFCTELLEYNLAVIPGIEFGMDGFIRFSYASSIEEIEKGLQNLKKFIKR